MDSPLRTGLWNALTLTYFQYIVTDEFSGVSYPNDELRTLVQALWARHFHLALDTVPRRWTEILDELRDHFFNQAKWYEVYEFIEFCAQTFSIPSENDRFRKTCNIVMEQEKAGCRFVAGEITEITSDVEIAAIEKAQSMPGKFSVVSANLAGALRLLSDKREPDYRNSIKESISAVEGMCSIMTDQKKADLSTALKVLEQRKALHTALKQAFLNLYGFTSDAGGIRHALLEESNLTFADAKFMLVSCSAFVNYLKEFIEDS